MGHDDVSVIDVRPYALPFRPNSVCLRDVDNIHFFGVRDHSSTCQLEVLCPETL